MDAPRFIVDNNVGKLGRWLRIMGYDAVSFSGSDDSAMVAMARAEGRVILTRDTEIMKRHLITSGRLRAILITSDKPEQQIKQVKEALNLEPKFSPFSICLECNQPLAKKSREQVKERVPPHVFKTQNQFVECPACRRIYWRGTHWQQMTRKLNKI